MIDKSDYHLFMKVMIEMAAKAEEGEDFDSHIERMIRASYEINCPLHGRVEVIDVTVEVSQSMGDKWHHFHDAGIREIHFVQYYLCDELVLETGRMQGHGDKEVVNSTITDFPIPVLRTFAKAMFLSMRTHNVRMLQDIMEGNFDLAKDAGDDMGLAEFIRQFLDEEVDDAVKQFSRQLDSIFSVADIHLPPPSMGEVRNDDIPSPPV
jgi:hypothetical protein